MALTLRASNGAIRSERRPRRLRAFAGLIRPSHWVKNVFVLAPLAFTEHQTLLAAIPSALLACVAFSSLSSAVYCFNDVFDLAADRAHPTKRLRPVAAGAISPTAALTLATALVAGGLLAALALPPLFVVLAVLYVLNNLLYSTWLKTKVIADVISIAAGFVLRLLAGAAAIAVPASSWLIVCGFALALLLGFGKRRAELTALSSMPGGAATRATLISYTTAKLDTLMSICGSVALVSYMLYTLAPETVQLHSTDKLIYTIPFVAYGIFRFIFKIQEGKAADPVSILLHDRALQATIGFWVLASLVIVRAAEIASLGAP